MTAQFRDLKVGDFVDVIERPVTKSAVEPARWFLIRIHPNREFTVQDKLRDRGIGICVPREQRSMKAVWGRRVMRTAPIFPGIALVPDFNADINRLKGMVDGIVGYIRFGERIAYVTPMMMQDIRNLEAVLAVQPSKRQRMYEVGQLVRVTNGPFEMWEGRIDRLDSHGRLRVFLEIVKRVVSIEVHEDHVEPVSAPKGVATARRQ